MSNLVKSLLTSAVVLIALGIVAVKYRHYLANPWTRDGQVRAQVVQINPRVSGPIIHLPVTDNQFVHAGDLLFEIDPRTFEAEVDQAKAQLNVGQVKVSNAKSEAQRYRAAQADSPGAVSAEELQLKEDTVEASAAEVQEAQAALEEARLNLEFTKVLAPVDGYVTNLNLRKGDQAVANQPALALVDTNSFWIHGFFRETVVGDIREGDRAIVTLMTYPDRPLEGTVDSIGWGIAQSDGSAGEDLLPQISPTFEWIRLAQRVPVRIHISQVPDGVKLRVGTTASVLVMKGTAGTQSAESVPPAPSALQ